MEIFKELNKKSYKHYYDGTIEELDNMNKNNPNLHSEIMQVIMWLYENFGIWISTQRDWDTGQCLGFEAIIEDSSGIINTPTSNTPTEAYQIAIEYCLTNLI